MSVIEYFYFPWEEKLQSNCPLGIVCSSFQFHICGLRIVWENAICYRLSVCQRHLRNLTVQMPVFWGFYSFMKMLSIHVWIYFGQSKVTCWGKICMSDWESCIVRMKRVGSSCCEDMVELVLVLCSMAVKQYYCRRVPCTGYYLWEGTTLGTRRPSFFGDDQCNPLDSEINTIQNLGPNTAH